MGCSSVRRLNEWSDSGGGERAQCVKERTCEWHTGRSDVERRWNHLRSEERHDEERGAGDKRDGGLGMQA